MGKHSRWVAGVLVILVIAIAGTVVGVFRRDLLWSAVPTPVEAEVRVNEATVCLGWSEPGGTQLVAVVIPVYDECYSGSCTARYDQRADVWINPLTSSLHFNSRFAFAHDFEGRVCTRDCGGAGWVELELPPLAVGRYGVWMGTTPLGEVEVSTMGTPSSRPCVPSSDPVQSAPPTAPPGASRDSAYPMATPDPVRDSLPGTGYPVPSAP